MVNFSELFKKLIIHNFLRTCGSSLGQVVIAHLLTAWLLVMRDTCTLSFSPTQILLLFNNTPEKHKASPEFFLLFFVVV